MKAHRSYRYHLPGELTELAVREAVCDVWPDAVSVDICHTIMPAGRPEGRWLVTVELPVQRWSQTGDVISPVPTPEPRAVGEP